MRIDSRKPKAAALSAALTVALLAGAGATDAHAATLSDTVGSTPSEATLVQPVDYRGDGYGSMQEWNASMEAKRDSLEMRAQIIMNMYGDYATDDERAVLQGCIDGAGSLLTMGRSTRSRPSSMSCALRLRMPSAKRSRPPQPRPRPPRPPGFVLQRLLRLVLHVCCVLRERLGSDALERRQ